ncbi:MAG: hypothetical protein ACRC6M_05970 [Microcystaceae cyanobacterium]
MTKPAQAACVIDTPTAGNLSLEGNNGTVLSSRSSPGFFTLSTCEAPISITIDRITEQGKAGRIDEVTAIVFDDKGASLVEAGLSSKIPPQSSGEIPALLSNRTYSIVLQLTNTSSLITAGDYAYSVEIFVTETPR